MPVRSRASPRCSPPSTGATSSRTPASRSRGCDPRRGRAGPLTRRRPFSRLAEWLVGALSFERTPVDPALLARLRAEVGALPPLAGDGVVAEPLWHARRQDLRDLLARGDLTGFLRWPPVRTTMVKRGHRAIAVELDHLRRRPDWAARWRPALREATLGRPRPLVRLPRASGNLVHLAYHLCRFHEATGVWPADMATVVEFGGGYGGMCRLVHRLGFRGRYVILDLPEVAALQRFYLGHVGIAAADGGAGGRERGVVTVTTPGDLTRATAGRPSGPALFIATWSLDETPISMRGPVLDAVADLDAFLLGYTVRVGTVDNRESFARWSAGLPGLAWWEATLPHLDKPALYRFGARVTALQGRGTASA